MDVPTSESVINWPFPTSSAATGPYAKGQGIYLAGDLRQAQSIYGSYFIQEAQRGNPDTAFMKQTSLGKLVGYNNQLPYYGNINWSNNVTGRGARGTSTQQVSMRDLSNYTVSNTVKEAFGSFGQYNAHSSSASPIRTYLASETIRSWVTASYQTASYGTLGVFAYKNNINRPRMGAFIQNRSRETDVLSGPDTASMFNTAVINYGVPTITGSNGGDLNFNVVPTVSSIGLSNTAESVTVTIPNRVSWPGNGNFDGNSAYLSQKRQGLLVYSNLGGDSGKLYYNRYLVSSSNPNGLSLALEVGSTTKLPNNDRNYCVLGLVEEFLPELLGQNNFRVPVGFEDPVLGPIPSDMSSANILYTQGLGWYSYIVSMTGSILYTGSRAYLGKGYPLNWRNENGAQMKQGFGIVGGQDFPGSTGSADDKVVLSYTIPEYNSYVAAPDYSSWVSNPSGSWYDYNTPITTTIISGSKKWQSKAIEDLGVCNIQNSLSTGSVVLAAMAHTGSSIDIGLYMLTGSGFIQLDYLAGVGSGNVDSTDRITLYKLGGADGNQNYNLQHPQQDGIFGPASSGRSYYTYASSSWDVSLQYSYYISSSGYVGLTYTTNDINPSTKIVYLRIDMAHLKFIDTTSLPTDSYGPYASLGGGYNYFFAGFPMGKYNKVVQPIVIGWEEPRGLPGNGALGAGYQPLSIVPIVPIVGSYYDSNAGTSEIKMSSIALY